MFGMMSNEWNVSGPRGRGSVGESAGPMVGMAKGVKTLVKSGGNVSASLFC